MSSAADQRWDQLTLSAKAAWRWAWATTTARTGAAEPSGVLVDTVDLLAGLALAHLRDNPVSQLFAHFRIPLGAVLSDAGARRYRPETLLAAYRRIPEAALPPLGEQAIQVLEHARTAMPPSTDGLVTLSMLFGALLENTNIASTALRAELANRGVDVERVIQSCREHLGTRSSYAEYLRTNHPYQPPERQLPPYAPDEPPTRYPPRQPDAEPPYLVDITAEVDAFAYLIAARRLTPPLAIGLFGDWGSGKSYFLRSVQRRIDQLVSTEVDQPPFHRAIAQIEFNAWQYVEGNLWASLLEHLFRNLRKAGEQDADDLLEARRSEYLDQITARTAEHRRAVEKRDELAGQQQRAHQLVQDKRDERDQKLADLENTRRRNPFLTWRPSPKLSGTLAEIGKRTGLGELGTQADELAQTLASTGETLRRAGPVLGALRTGGWRYTVALLVVIGLGPLVSVILSQLDASAVSTVIGSVSAVLAGVSAYAARGSTVLAGTLGKISQAQAELNKELDAQRDQFNQEIRDAQSKLADTQRELDSAIAEEQQYAASVAELEAELARITPSRVLAEFVGKRIASDDYRRHLGVPALVRQDLERLSRLIQQRHEAGPAGGIDDQHAIDRVVLYIDDLDRCPTDLVIKVLEAVHLLLAFPLFVVVVAVDARWLESSLREHYTQLKADAAVPSDYLEKIFQVPFWVRPLGADTRRQMVRGLLTPHLASPDPVAAHGDGPAGGTELSDADLPEFTRLVESFTGTDQAEQPWLEAAKLTVTGPELRLIEDISPLIGATPRAVKRFINVYLLLKSVGRGRGWPLPEHGQVAVLLAIATGLPELADELLPNLAAAEPLTLGTVLPATASGKAAGTQLARLNTWLDAHPTWRDVAVGGMDRWVELILRFRFDRGPGRTP
ncbi:MAG: P-loop NTPase fold protein [Pseudonocardiaceae bacterium]